MGKHILENVICLCRQCYSVAEKRGFNRQEIQNVSKNEL